MDIVRFHGRRQRRGAGGRVSYLPGGWDPYRYAGRFQGLLHDPGQVVAERVQVDGVFQPCRERGDGLAGVIPRAVEPPVHGMLDPDAHRIEQCGGSQCGGSHGNRRMEREHARGQEHEPGVKPDQQSGHDRVGLRECRQVPECYTPPTCVSWSAHSRWRSTNFWVLPVDVFGSGPNSIESGHL